MGHDGPKVTVCRARLRQVDIAVPTVLQASLHSAQALRAESCDRLSRTNILSPEWAHQSSTLTPSNTRFL
jgi:hypothetical protein